MRQTPDTDLSEQVRRLYGNRKYALMMEKMRHGASVPKLTHEECLDLMLECLRDPALHKHASEGFKKVRQTIDLNGSEDAFVCVARRDNTGTRRRVTRSSRTLGAI